MIKYEKEVTQLMRDIYDSNPGIEEDISFEEFMDEALTELGLDIQKLSDQLEVGVKNGFSVGDQIAAAKQIIGK